MAGRAVRPHRNCLARHDPQSNASCSLAGVWMKRACRQPVRSLIYLV
jgi:hypothetical protein